MNDSGLSCAETDEMVRFSMLAEIGKDLLTVKTIDETLQKIMERIRAVFAPAHWSILLKDPRKKELSFTLAMGRCASRLQGLKIPAGEGIGGWVVENGEPLIVEDVSRNECICSRLSRYEGIRKQSVMAAPLKTGEEIFGVVELIDKSDGKPFDSFDLKVLTLIADYGAMAIEKAYYFSALNKIADTDALTGAYNRRAFERMLEREVRMCRRYRQSFSLLMIHIVDFKEINDTHGISAGEAALKKLGEILERNVRKADMVFRYGADEFAILMPRTVMAQASRARHRIESCIQELNMSDSEIRFSVEIRSHCMESDDDDEILKLLDPKDSREKNKRFLRNIDNIAENIQEMLQEERKRKSTPIRDVFR